MAMNRRDFLRLGGAGMALGTMAPLMQNPFYKRSLQAAMMQDDCTNKMLLIFLRGGCDGVNMVIPHVDNRYSDSPGDRPNLYISPEDSYALYESGGDRIFSLHPEFDRITSEVDGIDLTNDFAAIHRVAYASQSRSHFDSQEYWETGYPSVPTSTGWVNSLINGMEFDATTPIPAASVGPNLQLLFRGSPALPHITNLNSYSLDNLNIPAKLIGILPGEGGVDGLGRGLMGVYSRDADDRTFDALTREQGVALVQSLVALEDLDPDDYVPENGATYPEMGAAQGFGQQFFGFFRDLKQAVMLLKLTDCRVAGIEIGGFDTHTAQAGQFGNLMRVIDHALWAVHRDTMDNVWGNLVVATMSEFGRTSAENGSAGTDHAEASVMLAAGGAVNGGAYNADDWNNGALFEASGRYLSRKTDYRAVLGEIIEKHFCQGQALEDDEIIPNWSSLDNGTTQWDYLDFVQDSN